MVRLWLVVLLCSSTKSVEGFLRRYMRANPSPYTSARAALVKAEARMAIGGQLTLTSQELKAEKVLMVARAADNAAATANGLKPLAATHFFEARSRLEQGQLFPLLQQLPKGAALHVHSDSMVPAEWLVSNITYMPHLWMCGHLNGTHTITFRFSDATDGPNGQAFACASTSGWRTVAQLRAAAGDPAEFDASLLREFTLVRPNPDIEYPTVNDVWKNFQNTINVAEGLVFSDQVFPHYLRKGFETFRDDGVQHVELRQVLQGDIGCVYTLNGTLLPPKFTFETIGNIARLVAAESTAHHAVQGQSKSSPAMAPPPPPFTGARAISCGLRMFPVDAVIDALKTSEALMTELPDVIAGFDLVGQEDPGQPLIAFAPELASAKIPFFFHAGETVMIGGPADENLVDALLLNSTRIGHGFALVHHPTLMQMVMDRDVGIEICPISNQVLKLVDDLRDHPLVNFASRPFPATLSPDDGALWGAVGSSHDWTMAFFALGDLGGLAMLKQLAINSLLHSALGPDDKAAAMATWRASWADYIARVGALYDDR